MDPDFEFVAHTIDLPLNDVLREYKLQCYRKDIDTDLEKEKNEFLDAFDKVEIKIKKEHDKQLSMSKSRRENLVNQHCRKNKALRLVTQKLIKKAAPCLVSSNVEKKILEIVQVLGKRACDMILAG